MCTLSLDTPPKWISVGMLKCREENGRESNSTERNFERKRTRWARDERTDLLWVRERSMNMSKRLDEKKRIGSSEEERFLKKNLLTNK